MFWHLFLTLAVVTSVGERLLHRSYLKNFDDARAYAFVYQLAGALILMPLAIYDLRGLNFSLLNFQVLLFMGAQALFWALFGHLSFSAERYLESSQSAIISRLRMVWALGIGIIFFNESVSAQQLLGIGLIFLSVLIINFSFSKHPLSKKGLSLSISATACIAISLAIDKTLTETFSPVTVAFFAFLFSALVLAVSTSGLQGRTRRLYEFGGKRLLLPALLGSISHGALVKALTLGKFALTIPIYQAGTIMTVLLGIVLLNERTNVRAKIAAAIVTYIGVLAITGY